MPFLIEGSILAGSWVVISRVLSRVTIDTTYSRRLRTPLTTTHETPSRGILEMMYSSLQGTFRLKGF